jgi:hypothetical protein
MLTFEGTNIAEITTPGGGEATTRVAFAFFFVEDTAILATTLSASASFAHGSSPWLRTIDTFACACIEDAIMLAVFGRPVGTDVAFTARPTILATCTSACGFIFHSSIQAILVFEIAFSTKLACPGLMTVLALASAFVDFATMSTRSICACASGAISSSPRGLAIIACTSFVVDTTTVLALRFF